MSEKKEPSISAKVHYTSAKESYSTAEKLSTSIKEPHIPAKEPCISAKEPLVPAEEPSISANEPSISTKVPSVSATDPAISAKESAISAKEIAIPAKEPAVSAKEIYLSKSDVTRSTEDTFSCTPFVTVSMMSSSDMSLSDGSCLSFLTSLSTSDPASLTKAEEKSPTFYKQITAIDPKSPTSYPNQPLACGPRTVDLFSRSSPVPLNISAQEPFFAAQEPTLSAHEPVSPTVVCPNCAGAKIDLERATQRNSNAAATNLRSVGSLVDGMSSRCMEVQHDDCSISNSRKPGKDEDKQTIEPKTNQVQPLERAHEQMSIKMTVDSIDNVDHSTISVDPSNINVGLQDALDFAQSLSSPTYMSVPPAPTYLSLPEWLESCTSPVTASLESEAGGGSGGRGVEGTGGEGLCPGMFENKASPDTTALEVRMGSDSEAAIPKVSKHGISPQEVEISAKKSCISAAPTSGGNLPTSTAAETIMKQDVNWDVASDLYFDLARSETSLELHSARASSSSFSSTLSSSITTNTGGCDGGGSGEVGDDNQVNELAGTKGFWDMIVGKKIEMREMGWGQ